MSDDWMMIIGTKRIRRHAWIFAEGDRRLYRTYVKWGIEDMINDLLKKGNNGCSSYWPIDLLLEAREN